MIEEIFAWFFIILLLATPVIFIIFLVLLAINCIRYDMAIDKNGSIVSCQGSGGSYDFDALEGSALISFLKEAYFIYRNEDTDIMHNERTAEFRIRRKRHIETIGYVTRDKVVFKGREYYFPEDPEWS